jgi:AraC family transcriptional regulator of adaptative response/methylated-DNA-[protein]-cysteine methyltransferase
MMAMMASLPVVRDEDDARRSGDDARWAAVLARDAAADGTFYYGVRSTGVYCRPSCPARRPRRDRVAFFDTGAAAEAAGYRACRRCRPREVSARQRLVAGVQQLLDTAESPPTLADLSAALGASPTYLQRAFKQATGLTPRQYAAARRAARLRAELRRGATVTEATYEAGYGSSRALYDGAGAELGMRPSAYRAGGRGERIAYAVVESPLGPMLVAATAQGVCALKFGDADALVGELRAEFPEATVVEDAAAVAGHVGVVLEHLAGRRAGLDLPLDVRATAFQERVWAALRAIPYGETRTYREVAEAIGAPRAARAVARACATNPVALVVPCHRVVRGGGALSGYRWGVERKRRLLAQERAVAAGGEGEA